MKRSQSTPSTDAENELQSTRHRLEEARAILEKGAIGAGAYRAAFAVFSESIHAAGLLRSLASPREEINNLLVIGARACLEIYRWRETLVGRITYMPSEEEEVFIDDTAANPSTFVTGVYAALASGAYELLGYYSNLADVDRSPRGLSSIPQLSRYCRALQLTLTGKQQEVEDMLRDLAKAQMSGLGEMYWVAQASALYEILLRDEAGIRQALKSLEDIHNRYYQEMGMINRPVHSLQLALLGLEGMIDFCNSRDQREPSGTGR